MGENGKRSRPRREHDGDSKNQKRRVNDRDRDRDEKAGDDELIVYRILCPDGFIGSVIGKSGKVINSIRQETRARVKVVDPFPGAKDRVITIYCYVRDKDNVEIDEEFDDGEPLCPAQDALIKVHNAIAEAIDSFGDSDKKWKDKEECKILVPSSQSANIIGKSGATIKRLRSKTRANIKVTPKDASDPSHSCAMEFDNFLVVSNLLNLNLCGHICVLVDVNVMGLKSRLPNLDRSILSIEHLQMHLFFVQPAVCITRIKTAAPFSFFPWTFFFIQSYVWCKMQVNPNGYFFERDTSQTGTRRYWIYL